jgi:hypothetical protein
MELGSIVFLFPFLLTLSSVSFFLLFVLIHSNPLFIINMFFHIRDAMCRIVRKNTFIRSCYVIILEVEAMGWHKIYAFHVLSEIVWTFPTKSLRTKSAQTINIWLWGVIIVGFSTTKQTTHAPFQFWPF